MDTLPRVFLTPEQAEDMLPAGDTVHTFMSRAPNILLGADWSRADLIDKIKQCKCEISGQVAMSMGHGLAIHLPKGMLFVQTKTEQTPTEP